MLKLSSLKIQVFRINITISPVCHIFHLCSFPTFSYNYPKQLCEATGVFTENNTCFFPFKFFIRPYSIKMEFDREILGDVNLWPDRKNKAKRQFKNKEKKIPNQRANKPLWILDFKFSRSTEGGEL